MVRPPDAAQRLLPGKEATVALFVNTTLKKAARLQIEEVEGKRVVSCQILALHIQRKERVVFC